MVREDRDAEKALGQINLGFFQEIITLAKLTRPYEIHFIYISI